MWIELLRKEVAVKGPKQVAKELGISRTTVDLVLSGKYGANTARIETRIEAIYGRNGGVNCEVLGDIDPAKCAEAYGRAKTIGMKAGNPETLRLYSRCLRCSVRT